MGSINSQKEEPHHCKGQDKVLENHPQIRGKATQNSAQALNIDRENGNDYWEKAINKEMKKAKVAYEEVDGCTLEEVRANEVP